MSYNAKDIKVMNLEEMEDKFAWIKAENLSRKYFVPLICVQRGLEASTRLGITPEYFIDKYLKRKSDIALMPEFTEIYGELVYEYNQQ